ncbi:unnamed protein product [Penicillium salamii]|uniref:Uncharacterized protein n=1 Tax=Penicillium salamii TaxID=1612424 RepID=A0A9W4NVV7_9EURO|nr:unnamed protein product [Penicillium salamii]CAG8390885.1 unnamed protein product [Penicillium salamii]CAG8393896.1 unnamed protein product [Penicillium salamii]CAG8422714.1 unnamed protein product [Penicillium salamii]
MACTYNFDVLPTTASPQSPSPPNLERRSSLKGCVFSMIFIAPGQPVQDRRATTSSVSSNLSTHLTSSVETLSAKVPKVKATVSNQVAPGRRTSTLQISNNPATCNPQSNTTSKPTLHSMANNTHNPNSPTPPTTHSPKMAMLPRPIPQNNKCQ